MSNFITNAELRIEAERLCDENDQLKDENAKLRELAVSYDSALSRMCSQMQGHVLCRDCILGKDYDNEDSCAIDELRDCMRELRVEVDE